MVCSHVLSPLSSSPRAHPSQREDESCNILKRYEKYHPVNNKVMQYLQVNKRRTCKYGLLPSKIVISTPWEALCIDLVGPYTLKGRDGSAIDFMALTMIDPASSWFQIMELPLVMKLQTKMVNGKEKIIKEEIFDKSSDCICLLANKILLCRYPRCQYLQCKCRSDFK
jgi:hypothetical protein